MKTIVILVGIVVAVCAVPMQKDLMGYPDGFKVISGVNCHEVTLGQLNTVKLSVLRSTAFSKTPIWLNVVSTVPDGMNVTFEPNPVMGDSAVARFELSEEMKIANHTVIISADSKTAGWPKKGIALRVIVNKPKEKSIF